MRANQTKIDANEVTLERAANGWIVSAKYHNIYEAPPSLIASSVAEAIKAAQELMTKPFVRSDDY